jgi:hypothetical protein
MRLTLLSLAAPALLAVAMIAPSRARAQQDAPVPPQITQFQKIEDQWSAALVKQDQYTLETILSPTYIDISAAGEITTRNQQVAAMYEKGLPQAQTMEQRVVNVRVIEDVAVVDGTYVERTKLNGVEHEERGVFTHVYQQVRGVWVCVHSQRTAVITNPVKEKAVKKKSDAELPFHIPFTHKSSDSDSDSTPPAPQQ